MMEGAIINWSHKVLHQARGTWLVLSFLEANGKKWAEVVIWLAILTKWWFKKALSLTENEEFSSVFSGLIFLLPEEIMKQSPNGSHSLYPFTFLVCSQVSDQNDPTKSDSFNLLLKSFKGFPSYLKQKLKKLQWLRKPGIIWQHKKKWQYWILGRLWATKSFYFTFYVFKLNLKI